MSRGDSNFQIIYEVTFSGDIIRCCGRSRRSGMIFYFTTGFLGCSSTDELTLLLKLEAISLAKNQIVLPLLNFANFMLKFVRSSIVAAVFLLVVYHRKQKDFEGFTKIMTV